MISDELRSEGAKELYIERTHDLLLHIKKVIQQALDEVYQTEALPEEFVSAYNQLVILLNNSISGLRLPASMIRSMLSGIRSMLSDQTISNTSEYESLTQQLLSASNIYISIANAEQELELITKKYFSAGGMS